MLNSKNKPDLLKTTKSLRLRASAELEKQSQSARLRREALNPKLNPLSVVATTKDENSKLEDDKRC